jgi:coenzyme F420-reducing hydrogenase beta subunit
MKNIKDIVEAGLCTGCGLCISQTPSAKMIWDEEGFLVPDSEVELDQDAMQYCPFNPFPAEEVKNEDTLAEEFLNTATEKDARIGKYKNIYVGYVPQYRETSSSGGFATYVFERLLTLKVVDHLFIVTEVEGRYQYSFFSDVSSIKKISKTRYIPVTLSELFQKIDSVEGKIAISGVACFIKAIRLKQHYKPELKEKIPFLVGIICGGIKSRFFTDFLVQKAGVQGAYHSQEYRIKDKKSTAPDYSFGAFDEQEKFYELKVATVGDLWGSGLFKANACDFCDDVTTELADISLGDAWLHPYSLDGLGNSVVVTRSELAEKIMQEGIANKTLKADLLSLNEFKRSQQGSFSHRQDALYHRIDQTKKAGKLVPEKRERFYVKIPFYFKRVQKQRMNVRKLSLEIWKEKRQAIQFEEKIAPYRKKLVETTLFYHRMKKLKNLILRK